MSATRQPPSLIVRTLAVTFVTAAALLVVIFAVVTLSARNQVRETVRANLAASQRMFAASQAREMRALGQQASNIAENPTLKAAMDTYAAEFASADAAVRGQLINTIRHQLEDVAGRLDADAIVLVDSRQRTLAAAGHFASAWPAAEAAPIVTTATAGASTSDGVVHIGNASFHVVSAPMTLGDGSTLGALYLATSLDTHLVGQLSEMAGAEVAIVSHGRTIASSLPAVEARQFESSPMALLHSEGTVDLDGGTHAFRRLLQVGDTGFFALTSVDDAARAAIGSTTTALGAIAIGAMVLALAGSVWLAHHLSSPIGLLATSLDAIARARHFDARLPLAGSSLELDHLTETFNQLMASVVAAEAETEAAYTAAIRALAAALDARDPYTAGHSERVSVVSVAIGRELQLNADDLEVLRLGALLHDIGKIGVPDDVLRKAGPLTGAEYDAIKEHTVLGARILRTVPFLSRHVEIVELHHERPDGTGYPHGLKNDEIPLAAHIVHVADAYDAMTSARAYRAGRPPADALEELQRGVGTDFHPDIVTALAARLDEITHARPLHDPIPEAACA